MTSKDKRSPVVLPRLQLLCALQTPSFRPSGPLLRQCSLQGVPLTHIPGAISYPFKQFGLNVMSSRRLPYVTVSRPEKHQSASLALPHPTLSSPTVLCSPCAPSSTPIPWLCTLSYLLNSAGSLEGHEASHLHFPVSSRPHRPVWLAGVHVTQMAPRVPSSWRSE